MDQRKNTLVLDRVTRLSLFIYKRSTKNTEKKLEQKLQCRLEHGEETIKMSEEGDENERRDVANDLLPCSGAFE